MVNGKNAKWFFKDRKRPPSVQVPMPPGVGDRIDAEPLGGLAFLIGFGTRTTVELLSAPSDSACVRSSAVQDGLPFWSRIY